MAKLTTAFTSAVAGQQMLIKKGQEILYSITLSSDWDGTCLLKRTRDGGHTTETIATITTAQDIGSILEEAEGNYFFECTVFAAGTATTILNNLSTPNLALPGAGFPSGTTVNVVEQGNEVIHKTILKLESTPITVISVGAAAGVGGTKVYDFPQGRLLVLGTMTDLQVNVATADEADFTDGTPEGDLGVGTLAPANADGLGTDATDDNFSTANSFTMANYAGSSSLASEAALQHDGTSTAIDMLVNALVDAADIDNDVTTTIYVSGTIIITWTNLGDF